MANRCARPEHPYISMEKFALTNLINTNKPKERPWSLANGIRQRHAWKRRDGSCWPEADASGRVQSVVNRGTGHFGRANRLLAQAL